jgi:hypothetical protein
MNDPELAQQRRQFVERCKEQEVPREEVSHRARENGHHFEGHLLESTIERVYGDENGREDEA